ncbi:MAG: glycosyltransferase, partial [Chloroflexi bacterium]|nr:glycosyltransferase [Chloroflexota bacterium]
VTPTLNAERYLEACLASVARQGVEVEHLLVDAGSTDRTLEMARASVRVQVIEQRGSSQTQAINVGLEQARGAVVAWLNADDMYADGALRFVVDRFAEEDNLDVLYGDCQVIGPNGEPLWFERPGTYDFRRLLRRGNYIAQPAAFVRRSVFERIGYLDESLVYAMDYDLWLRVRGLDVRYVPRSLAAFRWHVGSKSATSQLAGWREYLRIVRKHGGGWTPEMGWAYARLLLTLARTKVSEVVTGSTPLRPLTRGT